MRNHPVGSQLSAVQNDRVFAGGTHEQGPVMNLFNTEMLAKQFYPETFGEFRFTTQEAFGGLSETEPLFDRQRVADIITGDF